MEYKRDYKVKSRKRTTLKYKRHAPICTLVGGIGALCLAIGLYFGTDIFSDPGVDVIALAPDSSQHRKEVILAENSIANQRDPNQQEQTQPQTGPTDNGKSGILFGDYPGELFAISMTGEGSGAGAGLIGDRGRAYGLMQFDYRYALIPFCQWASATYPDVWGGLARWNNTAQGSASLVNNSEIVAVFKRARDKDPKVFIGAQCEYFKVNYFDTTYNKLKEQGIDLDSRHIAVSSAILSLQVNCGSQTKKICGLLDNTMSDEEMIRTLYENRRNGYLKSSGKNNNRWKPAGEEAHCMALLNGTWTLTQDYTAATSYSGGWFWSKLQPIYFK